MANLSPGYIWAGRESATPTKFHTQIDSAYITNVRAADCLAAAKPVYIATPGSPTTGDVRVGSSGYLEFYYGGVWNEQPPNELTLTLTNKSGSTRVAGDVVVADPANSASFTTATVNKPANVIGVVGATISNNASGLVYVRGVVDVRVVVSLLGLSNAGVPLMGPDGTSGTSEVKHAAQGTLSPRSDCFGIILQSTVGVSGTEFVTCLIWK